VAVSNGADLKALLTFDAVDADFASDVLAARQTVLPRGPAWPDG